MKGIYQILETFTDRNAKAELGEDLCQTEDGENSMVSHEVHLTVGSSSPLICYASEIPAVIAVLQKAKELADQRVERLFAEEALSTPNDGSL